MNFLSLSLAQTLVKVKLKTLSQVIFTLHRKPLSAAMNVQFFVLVEQIWGGRDTELCKGKQTGRRHSLYTTTHGRQGNNNISTQRCQWSARKKFSWKGENKILCTKEKTGQFPQTKIPSRKWTLILDGTGLESATEIVAPNHWSCSSLSSSDFPFAKLHADRFRNHQLKSQKGRSSRR